MRTHRAGCRQDMDRAARHATTGGTETLGPLPALFCYLGGSVVCVEVSKGNRSTIALHLQRPMVAKRLSGLQASLEGVSRYCVRSWPFPRLGLLHRPAGVAPPLAIAGQAQF